ncbi:hypothetical protein [Dishui Lake phycodnavirus 2]|nr:hypothetical protein [Dishui Lake phycodnavirus 2]
MTTNIQSFAGDVQINNGNLSVKSLEVRDGITKLASNNTTYSNVGVMMTRKSGASNVALLFTEEGANVVLGYTNDEALDDDRIDILKNERANLVVYGNVYVTGSVHGDGSTLTGLVTTLQSVTDFGQSTDKTILFTNQITGINVSSNVLVSGNVTANAFFGDGGLLSNITQTLEGITKIGNTTPYTIEFNNTHTSFVTVSNVGIGNALPIADLCVGANVVIDDEHLNKIAVTGNIAAHQLNLGSIEILPAYSLEQVTGIGNTTTNVMSFKNTTLAFDTDKMAGIGIIPSAADVGASGLHVDGHLRLGGAAGNTDEEQMYVKAAGALGVLANMSDTNNTNTALRLQSGDTNNSNITMVGKSSAQYMTFATNGLERMKIDSNGQLFVKNRVFGKHVSGDAFWSGLDGTGTDYQRVAVGILGDTTTGVVQSIVNNVGGINRTILTSDTYNVYSNINCTGNAYVSSNLTVNTSTLHVDATTNRVGLGTTNPQGLLHISSGTSGDAHLILEADTDNNTESDNPKIVFRQDGGFYTGEIGLANNQMVFRNKTGVSAGFIFYANVFAGSTTNIDELETTQVEVMRITGLGKVGIATAVPDAKLHVVGNAYVSSNLTVDSDTFHVDSDTNRVGVGTTAPLEFLHVQYPSPTYGSSSTELSNVVISSGAEFSDTGLFFRTPFTATAPPKCALIASGGGWSGAEGRLDICFDTTLSNEPQYRAQPSNAKVTFKADGKVGLGTTSPKYKLDVYNGTSGNDALINPAIDNDIILFDDQSSATTFNGTVYGNATRNTTGGYIQLTPNALGQTGWVTWPCQLPNSWTCEFDMWRGSVFGADQIHFIFYHDNQTTDPLTSDHFRITTNEYGGDSITLFSRLSATDTTLQYFNLDFLSATYQKVVVNYDRGSVSVSVDGVKYINYKIAETARLYTGSYVSFRGNTGSESTEHRVRNIRITKGNKWVYSGINSSDNICYLNGKVGIGTTNPTEQLHVRTTSSSSFTQLFVENTNQSGRTGLSILNAAGEYLNIQHVGGPTATSNVAILENFSTTNSGFGFYAKGDGEYRFRTTDSNSTRFLITNGGDVAIGAITPSSKLHVDGDVRMKTLSTNAIGKITPVYIRGTGSNNVANRLVKIGDTTHVNSTGRGLTLTIINASTHAHVSSTNYDTFGSTTASDNLAAALEAMTDLQIGILTSWDAFEERFTGNLVTACFKLGLTRLAGANNDVNRHPYCAIFYGPGASGVAGNHAIEVMKSDNASGAYATLSTLLVDDSFMGQTVSNALYSGTADDTTPTVMVDKNQRVGVGTTDPGVYKMRIYGGTPNINSGSGNGYLSFGHILTNPTTRIENVVYGEATYINEAGSSGKYGTNMRFQPGFLYGGAMWATAGYGEPSLYGGDNIIYGGDINASGNDGTGAGQYYAGHLYLGGGIAWTGGTAGEAGRTYNGNIYFQTGTPDTTSSTDTNRYNRAVITKEQRFGLGTITPGTQFHMYTTGTSQTITMQNGSYISYIKKDLNDLQLQAHGDTGQYGNIQFWGGTDGGSVVNKARTGLAFEAFEFIVNGKLRVTNSVENRAFDFLLGTGDQTSRGDTGSSRALVKDGGEVLSINYGEDFEGGTFIQGALSKGSGSFKISHPLPEKKDTHYLVHSFIEGPQADNIYRGVVQLSDGRAEVNIDTSARMTEGTFVALNRRVQCFTSNETDWDAVKGRVVGNILTIECQNTTSTANVSWMVVGERQDEHMFETRWTDDEGRVITEPEKPFMYDETLYDHLIPQDPAQEEHQISETIVWPDMPDALEMPAEPIAYPAPSAPVVV